MANDIALDINLFPRQAACFFSPAREILYGGAVGGGKSHLLRTALIVWCLEIPNLKCGLFRRTEPEVVKTHVEGPNGFRAMLADLVNAGFVEIVKGEVRFLKTGSRIFLCHCKEAKDVWKYQSEEFHVLAIDEGTTFLEEQYSVLRSRVRMAGVDLPEKYKGMFPRILVGSNPLNVGHAWVKRTWIDGHKPMEIWTAPASEGGMTRQYIPAKMSDNPALLEANPDYADQVRGMGSPDMVRAMLNGDWDVTAGAYFPEFSRSVHVVRGHEIPEHWPKFRSYDHGSASPFSVGWWAVSDGTLGKYPRGSLIKYREWYGADEKDKGLKLSIGEIADGILRRDQCLWNQEGRVRAGPADPSIFRSDGGPSISEQFRKCGVRWLRGDNQRIAGWQEYRNRLVGSERSEHRPTIYWFDDCVHAIRLLPLLQHDPHNPNDLDTNCLDHIADEERYAVMSRRSAKDRPLRQRPKLIQEATLDELWQMHEDELKAAPVIKY